VLFFNEIKNMSLLFFQSAKTKNSKSKLKFLTIKIFPEKVGKKLFLGKKKSVTGANFF